MPLAEAIEEGDVWLTLHFMAGNVCRLIINAPMAVHQEITKLTGLLRRGAEEVPIGEDGTIPNQRM